MEIDKTKIRHYDEIEIRSIADIPEFINCLKVGGTFRVADPSGNLPDGFEIVSINDGVATIRLVHKLYEFTSAEEYKQLNIEIHNRKKYKGIIPAKYRDVIAHIKQNIPNPTLGICHGARNNQEVDLFKNGVGCEVIGTDISPFAKEFGLLEWDFHEVKEEWLDSIDFVYCNALDHSHSPKYAVAQWVKCLKPTGLCFIEYAYDKWAAGYNAADCFGSTLDGYRKIFDELKLDYTTIKFGDYTIFVIKKSDVSTFSIKRNL